MRKTCRFRTLFALAAAAVAAPASAITGNWVPDFEHPFVGLVVVYDANGNFSHRCRGSLLSPTKLLTAGHCTEGATSARVYFQQNAGVNFDPATGVDPVSGYPETCAAGTLGTQCATSTRLYNYGFNAFAGFPDTRDAGLVILDQAIQLAEYGELSAVGALDGLDTARGIAAFGARLQVIDNKILVAQVAPRMRGNPLAPPLRTSNPAMREAAAVRPTLPSGACEAPQVGELKAGVNRLPDPVAAAWCADFVSLADAASTAECVDTEALSRSPEHRLESDTPLVAPGSSRQEAELQASVG